MKKKVIFFQRSLVLKVLRKPKQSLGENYLTGAKRNMTHDV